MTKIYTKLLLFLSVLICSLCLCFGLAACNPDNGDNTNDDNSGGGEHTHTFGGFWLFDGADGHYQLATCHPEVKSKLEPHVDENNDDICDVCDYDMSEDGSGNTEHAHTFAEEWTFNEAKHWHNADCEHFTERSAYADHIFVQGVCKCGVKESEVKVYGLYKNSPEYDLYFPQWLEWLTENGITSVEYTESGDGIYHYADGTSEVRFLGERTVKVKAQSSGEPLADVWFMVTLYDGNKYYELNGTIALGIAKTDSSGIAEITFNPAGGYSSTGIEYRIRIALAADVAEALGIEEDNAKPIPNRYEVSSASFEYVAYEVSENSSAEDIVATVNFTFSKGWNAYEQFTLPYARYYEKPYEGEDLKETGTTYEFTASGENLFDYFYFVPSREYSFASADSTFTTDQLAVIVENFQQAASGIYRIYFTVEGNATASLYYWNEGGVNMGAYHVTKADGTPSDDYITSISGGIAGNGKYTGANYVEVVIEPENGLRQFQFGLICDSVCKVTITVERMGDYEVDDTLYELKIGSTINITLPASATTPFLLVDVPEGLYYLTVLPTSSAVSKQAGLLSAYTLASSQSCLWENGIYKGIIRISSGNKKLYINNESIKIDVTISLENYEISPLKADESAFLPASSSRSSTTGEPFEIPLDQSVTSGTYLAEVTFFGNKVTGSSYTASLVVGDVEYSLTRNSTTYSAYIQISAGDTIKILNSTPYYSSVIAQINLISFPNVNQGETKSAEFDELEERFYSFIATQGGTYQLTITQTNNPEFANAFFGYMDLSVLNITNVFNGEVIKYGEPFGPTDANDLSIEITVTLTLEEGESMLLCFKNTSLYHTDIDFKIEYVSN